MKEKPITIFRREALLLRRDHLDKKQRADLKDLFTYRFYEDRACAQCEYRADRHCDICDNCEAFKGVSQLAKQVKINNTSYLSYPIGGQAELLQRMRRYGKKARITEKHPTHQRVKKKHRVKFTGELRDPQKLAVSDILERRRGVLKAPPRSGKTVMGTAFAIDTKCRTLFLASQRDWLMGFYETFCGSPTQKPLTNAKGVGTKPAEIKANLATGKRFDVGFVRTKEDVDRYNYGLATVQTFYANPKLLAYARSKYNVVIVDEIHTGAAAEFSRVLSAFNSEYYLGLSGTPNRKDQRYVIVDKILGPIIHEMQVPRLRPTIKLTPTKYVNTSKNPPWPNFVTNIENNKPRLNLIVDRVVEDVKAGHMVLIVMARIKAINNLVQLINAKLGEDVAQAFTGSTKDRPAVLDKARNYEIKVLVGQQKIMTTGVNIPRASALYEVTPSSNIENCEQRVSRILTPYEGKPDPIVRIFLDDAGIRRNCLRNEWTKCMLPIMKARITTTELKILETYLGSGASHRRRNWDSI